MKRGRDQSRETLRFQKTDVQNLEALLQEKTYVQNLEAQLQDLNPC
jgi:hypothetical protein